MRTQLQDTFFREDDNQSSLRCLVCKRRELSGIRDLLLSYAHAPINIIVELQVSELTTSVADQGPGIDEMEQEMIFEKFYRGREQRMIIPGTGMGLPIAKSIVELHGGKIGVVSQPGRAQSSIFRYKRFSSPPRIAGRRAMTPRTEECSSRPQEKPRTPATRNCFSIQVDCVSL